MEIQLYADIPLEEAMDSEEEAIQILVDVLDGAQTTYNEYDSTEPSQALSAYILNVSEGKVSLRFVIPSHYISVRNHQA